MAKAKASKRKAAAAAGADAAAAAAAGAAAAAPVAAVAAAPAGTPRGGGKRRKAVAVGEDVRTPRSAARGGGGGGGGGGALSETVYESDDEAEACQNMPWMESVVKIFCMHVEPNFSLPWQRKRQYQSTGSGFAIAGGRILTNAHCVDHHTQVKVRRRGDDAKYIARVLAVGVECDLALLAVDDEEFHKGLEPLPFGTLPRLHSAVTVVGYPLGGDTISVTSGVVSRVEVTAYAHGASELLGVQIDAAINSGNSGGPAFNGRGECVGVAFQSLKSDDAENIGYVIPPPVVQHFLRDYEKNGKYTGFPRLGIEWQRLESPYLRESLGMGPKQKGVLVRRVEPTSACADFLKAGDVIMSFDGTPVANDGTVPFRAKEHERISFSYLISCKYNDETAKVRVLRAQDRKEVTLEVPLGGLTRPVPVHIKGKLPSYFICGGMVFTRVTVPYLRSEYGKEYEYDAPVKLLDRMMNSMCKRNDEQVVVLGQVLASELTLGYEDIVNCEVLKFNNKPVLNLPHLAEMVDTCTERYMTFDLQHATVVVLDTEKVREASPGILAAHGIQSERSADLAALKGASKANKPKRKADTGPSAAKADGKVKKPTGAARKARAGRRGLASK